MKILPYILWVMLLASIPACVQRGKSKNVTSSVSKKDSTLKTTTMEFTAVEHDFGKVKEGEKLRHVFEVLNTGKTDLVLQSVRPSCGCTTSRYDQKPIRSGKKGTIEIAFNTEGRPGKQRKSIIVTTNTEPPNTVLFFNCEVIPANIKVENIN